MACCNPLFFVPPNLRGSSSHRQQLFHPFGYQIPCGYCLNCRVDKRNMWSDRAKYELCKRLTGSFVTLTYDDVHLMDKLVEDPSNPFCKELRPTLDYKEIRRYINRLRMFVKRHPEIHGVLCQPDFSYIFVGEYGENGSVFDRPHFHILFFGLDFAFMRKIFFEEWKNGICDVLPVLDGAIGYVLKYMDKQLFGDLAYDKYDKHGLARPARGQSRSFGAELYKVKAREASQKNWTYKSGRADRPYPIYYRNKFTTTDLKRLSETYSPLVGDSVARFSMKREYHLKNLSLKAVRSWKLQQAQLRERKLRQQILDDGVGVFDYVSTNPLYYKPRRDRISKLDNSVKEWLCSEYMQQIRDELEIPF